MLTQLENRLLGTGSPSCLPILAINAKTIQTDWSAHAGLFFPNLRPSLK